MTSLEPCRYTTEWHLPVSLVTTICNFIASIGCFYFISAILRNKSTRKNTFNLYVVFLLLPDGMNTALTGTVGVLKAVRCGTSLPDWYGAVFDFNNFFFYLSNFYLNCCVAYEIFAIAKGSHRLRKIKPPKKRRMLLQVGCVYTMSFLFALWGVLDVPWSFYDSKNDEFGSPQGNDGLFNETAAIVFMAVLTVFPILFVVGIRIQLWRKNLLRSEGRTRTLYLFFERITIVFIAMYIPCVALNIAFVGFVDQPNKYYWTERAIHMIKALQAGVTLYIVAFKNDIRKAVKRGCFASGDIDGEGDSSHLERGEKRRRSSTLRGSYYGTDSLGFPIAASLSTQERTDKTASIGILAETCTGINHQEAQEHDEEAVKPHDPSLDDANE